MGYGDKKVQVRYIHATHEKDCTVKVVYKTVLTCITDVIKL